MARVEADRDDLMREAIALVRRIELQAPGETQPIVVGFRTSQWLSLYFGQDLMYQFDELGRLRRAFEEGFLYRSEGTCLAKLQRQRSVGETTLVRRDLQGDALVSFRERTLAKIGWLCQVLGTGEIAVTRQIPAEDVSLMADIEHALTDILKSADFLAPAIRR